MIKAHDLVAAIERIAPPGIQESGDNSGLLISPKDSRIERVLISLELTGDVIEETRAGGYDFLIVHHPLFFMGAKRLTYDDPTNSAALSFIRETGAGLYAAHTSFDGAEGGLCESLADILGIEYGREPLIVPEGTPGKSLLSFARKGHFKEAATLSRALAHIEERLGEEESYRYRGDEDAIVGEVLVCCGGGGELTACASALGCSLFITGDVRNHEWRMAEEAGIALIDAGHYNTEKHFAEVFAKSLRRTLTEDQGMAEHEVGELFATTKSLGTAYKNY